MNSPEHRSTRSLDPLDRARQISLALSEAARMARFSTRTKANYSGGGFAARRGAKLMRYVIFGSLAFGVIIPSIVGFFYYSFVASDQYVSEGRFSVTGNILPQLDGISALNGFNAAIAAQDTQIIVNYIGSRAAIESISSQLDIKRRYSDKSIDALSRFDTSKPIEKFIRYWQSMVSATISMPAGIVVLKVRAFKPDDSVDIANAVIASSEALVNEMNIRVNADAVKTAEAELERATARLTHARLALEKTRNDQGILDAYKAGDAINALISEARSALIVMQQEYNTKSKLLSTSSPQMKVLKERIDATVAQIDDLQAKLTSPKTTTVEERTISSSISRFAELDLERQISERLYAGAVAAVEVARIASEKKQIYLNSFVAPAMPQEPEFPKRLLYPSLLALTLLGIWGSCVGLLTLIRNHMA